MAVKIIDSIMGSGKTEWAIGYMNANPEKKFMYISPYNNELKDRIIPRCPALKFRFAQEGRKVADFKSMLAKGENVVATTEVFKRADEEVEALLETHDYTLIMDEVFDVVINVKIAPADVEVVLSTFSKVEDGKLVWTDDKYPDIGGKFSDIKHMAKLGNLMVYKGSLFFWLFPVEFFRKFNEVFIMTFLFPCQIQRYYFDMHSIAYKYYKVTGNQQEGYRLMEHDGNISNCLKPLIHTYEGSLNDVGRINFSLSKTWYGKPKNKLLITVLRNNLKNYFRNLHDAKSDEIIWTTFKDYQSKLKGDGYSRGFVECNCRATNKYRERSFIAYCINKFMNSVLENDYFAAHGITVNEDLWALSEMLQFLWRSSIRIGQQVHLYCPSKRMRTLLQQFLDNELTVDYANGK